MKKLISIGIALALLTMVVLPGAVGAYTDPQTYAKIPFAIVASGLLMVQDLLTALIPAGLGIPAWLPGVITPVASWAGGPLSWTVDMLAWGLGLGADIWATVASVLPAGISKYPIGGILDKIACGLRTCFDESCAGNFTCP